ncbi:MAG: hypothetical protein HYW28_02840 [Rhodospirillales bacterium]|nr:hypothetical protein [Rhodospirillales bacterium]
MGVRSMSRGLERKWLKIQLSSSPVMVNAFGARWAAGLAGAGLAAFALAVFGVAADRLTAGLRPLPGFVDAFLANRQLP